MQIIAARAPQPFAIERTSVDGTCRLALISRWPSSGGDPLHLNAGQRRRYGVAGTVFRDGFLD
jgi:hypothetical protein